MTRMRSASLRQLKTETKKGLDALYSLIVFIKGKTKMSKTLLAVILQVFILSSCGTRVSLSPVPTDTIIPIATAGSTPILTSSGFGPEAVWNIVFHGVWRLSGVRWFLRSAHADCMASLGPGIGFAHGHDHRQTSSAIILWPGSSFR